MLDTQASSGPAQGRARHQVGQRPGQSSAKELQNNGCNQTHRANQTFRAYLVRTCFPLHATTETSLLDVLCLQLRNLRSIVRYYKPFLLIITPTSNGLEVRMNLYAWSW